MKTVSKKNSETGKTSKGNKTKPMVHFPKERRSGKERRKGLWDLAYFLSGGAEYRHQKDRRVSGLHTQDSDQSEKERRTRTERRRRRLHVNALPGYNIIDQRAADRRDTDRLSS